MMSEGEGRSIIVPIDLHGISRDTLEFLVRIANQLDRGLLGLLLENIELQRVADLPFTTEITLSGGRERSLLRDHLSQRQSQVSNQTRQQLHELANRDRVSLSFESAAGARWHTALEREGAPDIFFPARQQWHAATSAHARRGAIIKRMGLVLPENLPSAALQSTAAALLRDSLVGDVYVLSNKPVLPEQLHALYRPGHQVRVQGNFSCSAASIIALILHSPYDLLMLPRECLDGAPTGELDAALDNCGSQVLVIS